MMKTLKTSCLLLLLLLSAQVRTMAQNTVTTLKSTVEPLRLSVGYAKTTNLIFPYSIKSIDRGSKDVLVQKAKGVDNILQVKAGIEKLKETNLTVVTADGALYSFLLNYSADPTVLNLNLGSADYRAQPLAMLESNGDSEAKIQTIAEKVALKRPIFRTIRDKKYDVGLALAGLYIDQDVLYYQIALSNHSNIGYGIDQLRFFICDRKKSKRTASQEIELKPLHVSGNVRQIEASSRQMTVFAMPKFTIPDNKYLAVQLMEKNGGRHLSLKTYNRSILRALQVK